MAGAIQGDYFVGKQADDIRGLLTLRYPMNRGIVEDWNEMERIFDHVYEFELEVEPSEHAVLITECAHNPRRNRELMAQYFFENCNVPALFISMPAVLSLYASGATTGVVLDSGEGVTSAVAVYKGYAIQNAISRIDIAGRDVTSYLQMLLRRNGYSFHKSSEFEIIRQIKETKCYIPKIYTQEEDLEKKEQIAFKEFMLPDGHVVKIGGEQFKAPEILFKPELIGLEYMGVHDLVTSSIMAADLDIRPELCTSMYLAGGCTLFDGFGDRILNEIRKKIPKNMKLKIMSPPERKYTAWIGGSILSMLAPFQQMCITKQEYEEGQFNIVHKKTM